MKEAAKFSFNDAAPAGSLQEKDPVTGFYTSDALLEQLYDDARDKKRPRAFLVCGDLINMKQVNEVAGRPVGNDVIGTISAIYQKELATLNPAAQIGFRVHGDENGWIIEGGDVTEAGIVKALEAAEAKTLAFVAQAGLTGLQHPRHDNVTGTGLSTSFTEITPFSGTLNYARNTLSLQLDTMRHILPKQVKDTHPSSEFLHEYNLHQIKFAVAEAHDEIPVPAPHIFPAGFEIKPLPAEQVKARNAEVAGLSQTVGSPASFSRFNLYNLGAFNALLGNDHVDKYVLQPLQDTLIQSVAEAGVRPADYDLYKRDGAEFDLVIRGDDGTLASQIQARLYERMNETLFHRTVDEIAQEHGLEITHPDIDGDTFLANIPHKREKTIGGGLTMVTVDLSATPTATGAFQKIEEAKRLQERHGISYFSHDGPTGLRAHLIRHSAAKGDTVDVPQDMQPDIHCNPCAWGMNENLSREQLGDLFKKPAGLIYEAITGISLQPVLDRQRMIFNLLDKGVSAAEIQDHLEPLEKFDRFVGETMQDQKLHPFDLAGRPSTRPQQNPAFLTFNLARSWGFVPPGLAGIDNTLLQAQAAVRALDEINQYRNGYQNVQSAQVFDEIRARAAPILADAATKTSPLYCAQVVEHGFKIAKHTDIVPDPRLIVAGYSLVGETLASVAASFKNLGLDHLSRETTKLAANTNLGNRRLPVDDAVALIKSKVDAKAPLVTTARRPDSLPVPVFA